MTKIQCKLGGFSPTVMGHTYHFTRDPEIKDAYTCDVTDPKHVEMLLAVEHYVSLDEPEPDAPAPAAPPAPTALTEEELLKLMEQAGKVEIETRKVNDLEIFVVTGPWPEIVGVPTAMLKAEQPWYSVNGDLLHIDVMNGRAKYARQGMLDDGGVYKLDGAPFFEAPPEADKVALLPGSAATAGPFDVNGAKVDLSDVISGAVNTGNYSPEAWNGLTEAERDALISAEVERLKGAPSQSASHTPAPVAPPAPTTDKPQLDHDGDGKAGGAKKPRRSRKAAAQGE